MDKLTITTLGELKEFGIKTGSIKEELRRNLLETFKNGKNPFTGIIGYEDTVIPDIETAILSGHNMLLLGLRGQAKTKIARLFTNLLDEYIPVIKGTEINDDPFNPVSFEGKKIIEESGDNTPVEWLHRDERYSEKLATPDVTIADLIGDVDPIKAANLRLPYSDERVIHFGIIPRSHRGIFVINELPDLQARIQVALFNLLQEKDAQIRGFKLRLPLDIQFVFTANPEDYTNRGSIVTPLKDRIESQILTHYPKEISIAKDITKSEARVSNDRSSKIFMNDVLHNILEEISFQARKSEYIDINSGVSARLSISALENLYSSAERRMLKNNESETMIRVSDFKSVIPAITGKVELVYEGEQEGPFKVANILIGKAIKEHFSKYFPNPDKLKKVEGSNPYKEITNWFNNGNSIDMFFDESFSSYKNKLASIPGLEPLIENSNLTYSDDHEKYLLMEFALNGLAEYSLISKLGLERKIRFDDMLSGMFSTEDDEYDYDDNEPYL
ncbi:MAG: magnesium chelatase [Melioribacteraceae bacterium]|nr:MAG: magnesium chelatase [Melioribacteraceae bacterium]